MCVRIQTVCCSRELPALRDCCNPFPVPLGSLPKGICGYVPSNSTVWFFSPCCNPDSHQPYSTCKSSIPFFNSIAVSIPSIFFSLIFTQIVFALIFLHSILSTTSPWLLSHMSMPLPNTSALTVYTPSSSSRILAVGKRSRIASISAPEYLNFTF